MRLSMPFSDAFAAWFDVGFAAGVAAVFTAGFKARPPARLYEGGGAHSETGPCQYNSAIVESPDPFAATAHPMVSGPPPVP